MINAINKLKGNYTLSEILIFMIFLTSSFDIFLSFEFLGFTFRISQILCLVLFCIYFVKVMKSKKLNVPVGYRQLIIWTVLLLLFTFNTKVPMINIGYHLWLIFNILIIFSFVKLIENKETLNKIFKLYIMSFVIMGIIGIVQFVLGICGINLFISQWWIPNKLPRINGLSYEPSYYATYLLIGWTICRVLIRNKDTYKKIGINMPIALTLITLAMILTSSRMGIALMIFFEGVLFIVDIFRKRIKKTLILIGAFLVLVIEIIIVSQFYDLTFLLQGTGINGTASHSVSQRGSELLDILEVFKASPILGRGLGGIYVEIAQNKGLDVNNINVQDEATGISVFAEVLAASGIIGFGIFIAYICKLIIFVVKENKKSSNIYNKYIAFAIIAAFIMELIILQFNQNILRIYLWLHIAIISSYCKILFIDNVKTEGVSDEDSSRC